MKGMKKGPLRTLGALGSPGAVVGDRPYRRTRSGHQGFSEKFWCERGDSNPHAFRHEILNLARLPIPPLSHGGEKGPLMLRKAAPIFYGVLLAGPRSGADRRSGSL